jgi:Fe-S cluster assembly iron-binding protein IscA
LQSQISKDEDTTLEIIVGSFSWSGVSFNLVQAEQKEHHFADKFENFTIIVDKELLHSFPKFTVDYSKGILGSGFVIRRG